MNADDFVKQSMLRYPSLFPNRIAVLRHALIVIGNGLEWSEKGELVRIDEDDKKFVTRMDYNDIKEEINKLKKEQHEFPLLKRLYEGWLINAEFELIRRKFIAKNIDAMAKNSVALLCQDYDIPLDHYMLNPCYDYARIFFVPKNVTPSWAQAVYEMAEFWKTKLNQEYQGFYGQSEKRDDPKTFTGDKAKHWELFCVLTKIQDKMAPKIGRLTSKAAEKVGRKIVRRLFKQNP